MIKDLLGQIVAEIFVKRRTPTETLGQAANLLRFFPWLAYASAVEGTVLPAIEALDPSTSLKRRIVEILQQFYKFPYGISA